MTIELELFNTDRASASFTFHYRTLCWPLPIMLFFFVVAVILHPSIHLVLFPIEFVKQRDTHTHTVIKRTVYPACMASSHMIKHLCCILYGKKWREPPRRMGVVSVMILSSPKHHLLSVSRFHRPCFFFFLFSVMLHAIPSYNRQSDW